MPHVCIATPPTVLLTGNVNVYPCLADVSPSCTYWALQKEILWAEFNRAEIIPTSLRVKTNYLLWTLLTNLSLLHTKALWVRVSPCFSGILLNSKRRRRLKAILSHSDAAICKSQFWKGTPVVPRLHSKRSSSQQRYWFTSFDLSLLSRTVYITLSNPLLNRL